MSLRRIYKLIALLLAFAIGIALAVYLWNGRKPAQQVSTNFRTLTELAEPHRGSVLAVGRDFIEYALPSSADTIRITSNANLKSLDAARNQRRINPAKRWQYALQIEEVSTTGEILRRRVHHFRRDLVEVEMPGGQPGTGSFYLQDDAPVPLPAASLRLNFAGEVKPARVRIRLLSADADIADVLVRAAVPAPQTQRSAETTWQRLSAEQRKRLAAGNVFPPELLIEQERNNLMASRWQPLGPTGDVVSRDIYVLRNADLGATADTSASTVLAAGPQRLATVQLPEEGGKVRVELEAINEQEKFPAQVSIRWAGHSAFLRSTSTHRWDGGQFEMQSDYKGGWLEIAATRAASVRIWLVGNGQEKEITPSLQYLRAWPAQNEAPLEFLISHAGNMPTPLRLVLRRIGTNRNLPADTPVQISLINGEGNVLDTLPVAMQAAVSQYDGLWPPTATSGVTDPVEAFFKIPLDVKRVRITSADPVLVNAYSRPLDLERAVRTPEDTIVQDAAQTAIPAWFALQPVDYEARILNGATRLLTVQERLPDDRPDLAGGRYQWEDFNPTNKGAARVFFAPREEGVPDRMQALAGTFRPVSVNGTVHFLADTRSGGVAPRLAWIADRPQTFSYAIFIDGREWISGTTSGIAGEIVLPSLEPGRHHVRIQSSANLGWYASHVKDGTPWVKRSAYRFDKPLSFEVERISMEEEFLSVRLFRPAGADTRMKVRVRIDAPGAGQGIGPFSGWLFTERVHDIRPSGEFALPIAETTGERTDAGQPFYIPFPKGAPRGRYRITLIPQGGIGWVSVSRITAGILAKPKLIIESVRNEE